MTDSFGQLCTAYGSASVLLEDTTWTPLASWPLDASVLRRHLYATRKCLPANYDQIYLVPLLSELDNMVARIVDFHASRLDALVMHSAAVSDALIYSDSLVGAATAWTDPKTLRAVQCFEAVVSDLFRSFVTKSHPALADRGLATKRPPLVTFATQPSRGPATLNADVVRFYCTADISIVSLPAGYADHPALWGVLAHEAGGHAITHAIPGLAEELAKKVPTIGGLSVYGKDIWKNWVEESAADVYALLNMGPSYVLGIGAWLKMAKRPPQIGTSIRIVDYKTTDSHPADLLRLYLLKGATEALRGFDLYKADWLVEIQATLDTAAPNVTDIEIYYDDPIIPHRLPLAILGKDAETIGAAIVTMQLDSLKGHAFSDIENWDEVDENIARGVMDAAINHQRLTDLDADDAQLLAGITMALRKDPSLYNELNLSLGQALHESFMKDAVFRG